MNELTLHPNVYATGQSKGLSLNTVLHKLLYGRVNNATTQTNLVAVKHSRLTWGNGFLRLIKYHNHSAIRHWGQGAWNIGLTITGFDCAAKRLLRASAIDPVQLVCH